MKELIRKAIANPLATILACLALSVIAVTGLKGLTLNPNYDAYFTPEDITLLTHRQLQQRFNNDDSLIVALDFNEPIALQTVAVEVLAEVVAALEELPVVSSTRSILNLPAAEESDFDAFEAELLELEGVESPAQGVKRSVDAERVRQDPRGPGLLVSKREDALAVDVKLTLPEDIDSSQLLASVATVRRAVAQAIGTVDIAVTPKFTGPLILNEAYVSVIRHDLKVFLPALVASIGLVVGFLFGSVRAVVAIFIVAGLAVLGAFGVAGWFRAELAAIVAFAPVMIATIAVAACVHILNSYRDEIKAHDSRLEALCEAVNKNLLPLGLTTLSTAAGFLALTFSPSPPIATIGHIAASGVVISCFLAVFVFPALLHRLSVTPTPALLLPGLIKRMISAARQHSRQVLLVVACVGVFALPVASNNRINDSVFEYFPGGHWFQRDSNYFQENFSGLNPVVYSLGTSYPNGVFDVNVLTAVIEFQSWLDKQIAVGRSLAITNFNDFEYSSTSVLEEQLSKYRELATVHTPAALGIDHLVDSNYQSLAIHAYLHPLDARSQLEFDASVHHWWQQHYSGFLIEGGGTTLVFAELGRRNASSMVTALLIALVLISIACAVIIKSAHGVWIGIVCNFFPVVVVYAIWALIDGSLSIGGAIVIGMIMGIVVDDTIYLLTNFRRAVDAQLEEPVSHAISSVGPALIITSLAILAGFSAGLLSDFKPIRIMSGLSMAIVLLAVIIDLTVLSIVLEKWPGRSKTDLRPIQP